MISESNVVRVRLDKPSATIVIDREARKNAITIEMITRLNEAFEDLHQEKSVRAVILTGAGDFFSSGTDLEVLHDRSNETDSLKIWHEESQAFFELLERMLRFPKPIIASVNGPVIGSAAALMLASDYVIGSTTAQFQLPEAIRGLVPGHVAALLAFRVGASHASRLMLLGEKIDPQESHRIGLMHEVCEKDLVWARANELAKKFTESAPQSLQLIKQMLNETVGEEVLTQLSIGAANVAAARTTDAAAEGIDAYLNKRPPQW